MAISPHDDPQVLAARNRSTGDIVVSENDLKRARKEWNTRQKIADRDRPHNLNTSIGQKLMGEAQNRNSRTESFVAQRTTFRWLMPMITTIVIIFVLVGPGLAAAMKLLSSTPWYLWIAIIFGGLLLWRNR